MTTVCLALVLSASALEGQEDPQRLRGRVMLGGLGVDSAVAVLHRVSMEEAGEVDSVLVVPGGDFEFRIERPPSVSDQSNILFASVRYEGVLYFGPAVTEADQLDSLYVVNVFGAETAPVEGNPLPVTVRNVFLERWEEGWRATDLFQILNAGERTLVAAKDGVVWSYPLPPGATSLELGQGDLPPDAVTFEEDRVTVRAPLPPGERMLLIRYELPTLEAEFPAPRATETFDLLVKEPAPTLDVAGLQPIDVVALDAESTYRRYSATDLIDASVSIEEGSEGGLPSMGLFAVLLAALLGGVGLFAYLRPSVRPIGSRRPLAASAGPQDERATLILKVARLDESNKGVSDPDARRTILEQRAVLMARLRGRS